MKATITRLVAVGYDEDKIMKFIDRETRKILRLRAKGHRDFQGFDESSARVAAETLARLNLSQFRTYEERPIN